MKSGADNNLKIIAQLKESTARMVEPLTQTIIKEYGKNPYLILVSCLLSLRSRDTATLPICRKLFTRVRTVHEMLDLSIDELTHIIYPINFYNNKARTLFSVSKDLVERFDGKVPSSREELLSIKGVGIKTAALVLSDAFGIPAICVDTHVHRISNRLGIIHTKTVEQTEQALMKVLPKKYWSIWNPLLVMWGQNICLPLSPKCSECAIAQWCARIGVTRSR